MPRLADVPLKRLHIRLELDDYEWLKNELGHERLISETIRRMVKTLRMNYEKSNGQLPPIEDLLSKDTDL